MTTSTAATLPLGPLDRERSELLRRVVDGLDPVSLQWLSGFAAGVGYARGQTTAVVDAALGTAPSMPVARQEPASRFAVVYGSQTGNGKRIAERLGRAAEAAGLAVRVYAARDYPLKDLAKERFLSVVISTHGDGDPPDDARGFFEFITGRRAPRLREPVVFRARARRFELPEVLRGRPAGRRTAGGPRRTDSAASRRLRRRLRPARGALGRATGIEGKRGTGRAAGGDRHPSPSGAGRAAVHARAPVRGERRREPARDRPGCHQGRPSRRDLARRIRPAV